MKIRFFLTLFIIIIFGILLKLSDLLYSPLSGQITTNQLNDTTTAYVIAKFIRDNNVKNLINIIFYFAEETDKSQMVDICPPCCSFPNVQ